jgi:hypothetical protein
MNTLTKNLLALSLALFAASVFPGCEYKTHYNSYGSPRSEFQGVTPKGVVDAMSYGSHPNAPAPTDPNCNNMTPATPVAKGKAVPVAHPAPIVVAKKKPVYPVSPAPLGVTPHP